MNLKKASAFFTIFFIFLLLLIIPTQTKGQVRVFVTNTVMPGFKAINAVYRLPSILFKGSKLKRENIELKKEIDRLKSQIVKLNEAELENQRLKQLLELDKSSSGYSVPARVIARDSSIWRDSLILDKGRSKNIKKNMIAITNQGLVGRVTESGPWFSRVMVISDPNSRVSAVVQRSREQGIIEGNVRGQIRLKYLDADADVQVDDIVVTSGMGSVFPKGIMIGKIYKVKTDKTFMYKYAFIKPAANLKKIEEVLCTK